MKLVHGFYGPGNTLQVATIDAAMQYVRINKERNAIIKCGSYQEIRALLGKESFDNQFGEIIQEAWDDENYGLKNTEDYPPEEWEPSIATPDHDYFFFEQAPICSPDSSEVPSEILEIGSQGWSIASGGLIDWGDTTKNHLEAIREVCAINNWELTDRQDLFDQIY